MTPWGPKNVQQDENLTQKSHFPAFLATPGQKTLFHANAEDGNLCSVSSFIYTRIPLIDTPGYCCTQLAGKKGWQTIPCSAVQNDHRRSVPRYPAPQSSQYRGFWSLFKLGILLTAYLGRHWHLREPPALLAPLALLSSEQQAANWGALTAPQHLDSPFWPRNALNCSKLLKTAQN